MSDSATNYGDLFKRALVKLDALQARLDAVERPLAEPIAVIGIACRFPGRANDPETFWRLLRDGVDATGDVPADRWDIDAYYDPRPATPGKMYTPSRGLPRRALTDFDPAFFGISPREALSMDPQQRLLLEVAWEALEHAGLAPSSLAGRPAPASSSGSADWRLQPAAMCRRASPPTRIRRRGTPTASPPAACRTCSDLQGPSIAVDTACSSSLVAVHLACQSLRDGRMRHGAGRRRQRRSSRPIRAVAHVPGAHAAADGRCKTFDASRRRLRARRGLRRGRARSASPTRSPTAIAFSR